MFRERIFLFAGGQKIKKNISQCKIKEENQLNVASIIAAHWLAARATGHCQHYTSACR